MNNGIGGYAIGGFPMGGFPIGGFPMSGFAFNPSFVGDFQNQRFYNGSVEDFSDLFTFARSSTATYTDINGVIQTAGVNEPRFDYSTGKRGLLVEENATNLFTHSEDFSKWDETTTSHPQNNLRGVTSAYATAPDGQETATLISQSNNFDEQRIFLNFGDQGSQARTFSVFVKFVNWQYVGLRDTNFDPVVFDILNGTVHTSTIPAGITNHGIEDAGSGWYRIFITYTDTDSNYVPWIAMYNSSSSAFFTGDGTSGFLAWGAQSEQNDFPTSYIRTSGTSVTRAADVLTVLPSQLAGSVTNLSGTESITNGDFATDSDWIKGSGWSISGGQAINDGSQGATSYFYQTALTAGLTYLIEVDVESTTGAPRLLPGNLGAAQPLSVGLNTMVVTAAGNSNLLFETNASSSITINSVSVREVTMPSTFSFAIDGEFNYSDNNVYTEVAFLFWYIDSLNYIYQKVDTDGSNIGRPAFMQKLSGTNNIALGAGDSYSPGTNISFSVASRHSSSNINGAHEGNILTEDNTSTNMSNFATKSLQIGSKFNGVIYNFQAWNSALDDSTLQQVTS